MRSSLRTCRYAWCPCRQDMGNVDTMAVRLHVDKNRALSIFRTICVLFCFHTCTYKDVYFFLNHRPVPKKPRLCSSDESPRPQNDSKTLLSRKPFHVPCLKLEEALEHVCEITFKAFVVTISTSLPIAGLSLLATKPSVPGRAEFDRSGRI